MNNQFKSLQAENNALKAKDATQDTQLQELRAEIAALKASMTKQYNYSYRQAPPYVLQCNTQGGALYVKYFCET